jgi:hypothetical protein
LDGERVGAIEDCRHVSGALERFLIARGERVVRVAPKEVLGWPAVSTSSPARWGRAKQRRWGSTVRKFARVQITSSHRAMS